jgi:hypothetical protein
MKTRTSLAALVAILLLGTATAAQAEADWKRGRIYYRMVCTACHVHQGGAIAPSTKTMAEWNAYLAADKHAKGKDSVKYYVSQKYRESVKATNKAAEKYADVPEKDLYEDLKAFVIKGAKDGDSPASCN